MKYPSKVIRIKTYTKKLHQLSKMKFYALNNQITDLISLVPLREKYLYKRFFQSITNFKFTHDCYYIKFCLKQQSYFKKYMNKADLSRWGAPARRKLAVRVSNRRDEASAPLAPSGCLRGELAFGVGEGLGGPRPSPLAGASTGKPLLNIALSSRFQFSNEGQRRNPFKKDWMEYSGFLLLPLTTNRIVQRQFFEDYAQMHGLHLKFIKLYSLYQGLYFLGWFFQKKVYNLTGSISHANIQSHQKELKFYLKTSANKPVDHVISELNKKILYWQKFYNCSIKLSETCSQMNDYLFWLIWYWLKKRHRTRGAKWLYNRYWKRSSSRKWVFSDQNHTLIFYNL